LPNPAPNLNDNHRNALLAGFKYIDRLLADGLAGIAPIADEDAVFSPLAQDATPLQRKVVGSQIARIRRSIRAALEVYEIPIQAPSISAIRSLRSSLTAAAVTLEELDPDYLKGYGPLDDESAGRTRVATQPGGPSAAATHAAASAATSSARVVERYQPETAPAMDAMSDWSGAS